MITAAVQKTERTIYVYNEKGSVSRVLHGVLEGYTSTTVSVRPGPQYHVIHIYDEKGHVRNTLLNV